MELSQILITVLFGLMMFSLILIPVSVVYYKKQKLRLQGEFLRRLEISEFEKSNLILISQRTDYVRVFRDSSFWAVRSNNIHFNYKNQYGDVWIPEFRIDLD